MLRSLRRMLWWLQEKVAWPVADALRGERGGPAVVEGMVDGEAPRTRPSDEGAQGARPSGFTGRPELATLICLAVAAAGSAAILLALQSHLTFYADEWDFLLHRRGSSAENFLNPHGDHIALALVAVYKLLVSNFGMGSPAPFQVTSTLIFLLGVALLFVYLRRSIGDWPALLGSALILFLGASWTDLLWPFQIGFSASIAAGLGALLALDRDDRVGDWIACALLVVSMSFSEIGVPFVAGVLASILVSGRPRIGRLYIVFVPLALYGIWWLGWGHQAHSALTMHNVLVSPKFAFDAASQAAASLVGLATPLASSGERDWRIPVGMDWGRILLVGLVGVGVWRFRRLGSIPRPFWVALAMGASFWFLAAFNAIPEVREPTTNRYQYPGAVFLLLIAAEFLRGVRPNRRVLAVAAAVTALAVFSGIRFLYLGYDNMRKPQSDLLRAQLAAIEIARDRLQPGLAVEQATTMIAADSYLSAADAYGSPAFSEAQLLASGEPDRAAADQVLGSAEGMKLSPLSAADRRVRAAGHCQTLHGSASGSAAAATLGPGNYTLSSQKLPTGAGQVGVSVQAARFGDQSSVNLGFLNPRTGSALNIPADNSSRPWRLSLPAASAITLCGVAAPSPAPPPAAAAGPDLARINLQLSDLPAGWRLLSAPQSPPATRLFDCMGLAGRTSASAVAATGPAKVNAISELDSWATPLGPRRAAAALRQPAGADCLRSAIGDTFTAVGLPLTISLSPVPPPPAAGHGAVAYALSASAANGGPTAAAGSVLYFARGRISALLLTVSGGGQPPQTLSAQLASPLRTRMAQASRPPRGK
jgi:hypothetical protein